ncbi:RIP metalloprotease [Legionella sp. km772]|uniref:M50 family metallopeptidase n=1 Tax=Legionella sp. km772 TaxID=2498111 RepID=UPI000F8CCC1C|nr:site-2 protease family protein [Legionella sp. km772]RUR04641.1 peptidase [Legionella sp. km772]
MLLAFLAILLTLFLVIGIHEAGHALAAHLFHIKIKRIAIGFGKPLVQWQGRSGCEWVLGRWFLGGYVQLNNTRIAPVKPEEEASCFDKKPIWQRIIVLLAGACANIITAWLAFILVFSIGIHYRIPEIETVQANSVAAKAGIMPQEQFLSIAGRDTFSWQDVGQELIVSWGQKNIPVSLKTSTGEIKQTTLDLSQIGFNEQARSLLASLGLVPNVKAAQQLLKAPSLGNAIQQANNTISHYVYFFLIILKQLFTGVIPFSVLLGPIGLFATSIASLSQGILVFLYFIAGLSVAVAFINLFPIPGLDGGAILYTLIEKIRGEPISIALEILIYRLMMVLLFLILVQLLKNDLALFIMRPH